MKQNRPAPAYQEYAASMLADYNFRALSLGERGALYTLRLECWVNKRVPADLNTLAKAFGLPRDELAGYLPALDPFFKTEDGWLFSTELNDYRAYLEAVRDARSQGGKKGAAKTNAQRHGPSSDDRDARQVPRDSLDKQSKAQSSTAQSNSVINKEDLDDDWIENYNQAERY